MPVRTWRTVYWETKSRVPWSQQGGFQASRKHRVPTHIHLYKLGDRGKLR